MSKATKSALRKSLIRLATLYLFALGGAVIIASAVSAAPVVLFQ